MILTSMANTNRAWRTKLFTVSSMFVVPPDVEVIWREGCGGGGGGGGGNSTPGGGGGGGGAGCNLLFSPCAVVPNESLTITIGAAGLGGPANSNGTNGGNTIIARGATSLIALSPGAGGGAGANPNGGYGGYIGMSSGTGPSGGAGAGVVAVTYGLGGVNALNSGKAEIMQGRCTTGAAGGALSFNGGYSYGHNGVDNGAIAGGTGNSSGGGGGAGGCGQYGSGGVGGSNGAAGNNATGYGGGGGGGSGNAAGGNGSPGFVRVYCFTAYSIN